MKQSFQSVLLVFAFVFSSFRIFYDTGLINPLVANTFNTFISSGDESESSFSDRTHLRSIDLKTNNPLKNYFLSTVRINCGGTSQTFSGETWLADTYFTNGSGYSTSSAIANTTSDALYQTERFGNHSYSIPVTNGAYTVKLHFAEIYFSASNSRLFNVNIENGQATLSSYDVYLQAGAKNAAKIETFNNINVNDGTLNISFSNVKDNAKVSAIEVLPAEGNTPPTITTPIADQSVAYNTPSASINLANVFADNNGFNNLVLSVSGNTNTTIVTNAAISGSTLNLTLGAGQSGSSNVKVKATDAEGLLVEDEFVFTILAPAANTPPTVSNPIADQSVAVNTASLAIPLSNVFSDNNGFANLTLTITGNSNTALITSALINGSTLNLTIASGQTGSSTIKVKATDAGALEVEDEFIVQVNATPATQIRINSGSSSSITFGSETWIADTYYTNGSGYGTSSSIANTTNDALYQSERFGNHSYTIPVPSGTYTVKLHFAEIYFTSANSRLFNVNIENGQAGLSSYDVYLQAGGTNTAKVETFNNINVTDDNLNISFTNVKDNAKVSGIEVISSAPAANTPPTVSSPIADQSVAYNTPAASINLSNVFADNNGFSNLTLSVSGNSNTAIVTNAAISGSTLNLTLAAGQSGSSTIKIKATDAEGLQVEDEFIFTIQAPAANTPPTISNPIADQSVAINTASLAIPLSSVFTDNNGFANLTISITGNSNTALITSALINGSTLNLTIASGQTGSSTIKVKATDAGGLAVEDEFVVQVNATPATQIRINCGSASPITFGSETWIADTYYTNGSGYGTSNAIANTTNDALYQSERFGNHSYSIPVPSGSYIVKLHFAEIYFTSSNSRLFNVNIENGQAGLSSYDVYVAAGGGNTAKVETFSNINVTDGNLNISFTNVKDNAKVSGIEVISSSGPPTNTAPVVSSAIPDQSVAYNTASASINLANVFTDNNGFSNLTLSVSGNSNTAIVTNASISGSTLNLTLGANQSGSTNIKVKATDAEGLQVEDEFVFTIQPQPSNNTHLRINSGGGNIVFGSETWFTDQYYTGGFDYFTDNEILNTSNDAIYQSERAGNMSYNIPVPVGSYTLKLHFAETNFSEANSRLFNVNIENGQASLSNYDIYVQAGGKNLAKIEQFNNINVNDGFFTIDFATLKDNAKICAIEIISSGAVGPNQSPVALAGDDQTISLPTSSVMMIGSSSYDPDGLISGYTWSKLSGPSTYTIVSATSPNTNITGLVAGTYVFRLTVTDNSLATAFDDVTINVNQGSGGSQTTTFIALKSSWKYLDNGSNQGTSWRGTSYDDQSWASGNAELGYGDGDEGTIVSYGPSSNNKYITTYFRKSVTINNPSSFGGFSLGVKRDDGAVVYVNGTEVFRTNMPSGTISYTTPASQFASDDGATLQTTTLPTSAFVNGTNVIAVEIHQSDNVSSDMSFDLQLIGNASGSNPSAQILRGPYLQVGSGTAVTLRWRSDVATDSKISVGTSHGNYTLSATNNTQTTEHEVRITGLTPDTKYYYSFGSSSQTLQSGTSNYFRTAPSSTTSRKIGFAAFGDCGRNENGFQSGSLNAYQNYVGSNPADLMLLLGDNAYSNGTEAEYTTNFFNIYSANILKNHIVFPSPGNHDYDGVSQQSRDHAYYQAFSMPTNGESGGVPSGTESYYSFNWGNVHFLSLDSYGREDWYMVFDTTGPQATWIKNDLAANSSMWTVVYFHHPPYSMGSHSSDNDYEMIKIRENLIRIFERYGVDLVITGHSHDYERSYLMKNHFGNESSFDVGTHGVTSSSGKYDGTNNSCPYITSTGHINHGTVYVVAGSAGADGGIQNGYPHNALPFAIDDGGMFYFEVENNRLDAKFIRRDGQIADNFTMMKNAGKNTTVNISSGSSTTLTASWIGNYQWSNGANGRSITVSPSSNTTYTVTDPTGCIVDNFTVNVNSGSRIMTTAGIDSEIRETENADKTLRIYPVPVKRGSLLAITGNSMSRYRLQIINKEGKTVHEAVANGRYNFETKSFASGVYYVRIVAEGKTTIRKFMIID